MNNPNLNFSELRRLVAALEKHSSEPVIQDILNEVFGTDNNKGRVSPAKSNATNGNDGAIIHEGDYYDG